MLRKVLGLFVLCVSQSQIVLGDKAPTVAITAAVVVLNGTDLTLGVSPGRMGVIYLSQTANSKTVTVSGTITGLPPNTTHGFHIHELGNIGGSTGCTGAGAHYNPFGKNHGGPTASVRHVGDLGNVQSDVNGTVTVSKTDTQIQLCGRQSIVGRALVIHSGPDDLGLGGKSCSLSSGCAGQRVGCGVIGGTSSGYSSFLCGSAPSLLPALPLPTLLSLLALLLLLK